MHTDIVNWILSFFNSCREKKINSVFTKQFFEFGFELESKGYPVEIQLPCLFFFPDNYLIILSVTIGKQEAKKAIFLAEI